MHALYFLHDQDSTAAMHEAADMSSDAHPLAHYLNQHSVSVLPRRPSHPILQKAAPSNPDQQALVCPVSPNVVTIIIYLCNSYMYFSTIIDLIK